MLNIYILRINSSESQLNNPERETLLHTEFPDLNKTHLDFMTVKPVILICD